MTRDLVVEQFAEIGVVLEGNQVIMHFGNTDSAKRAYFVIKNALELGIPVQIRAGKQGDTVGESCQ